MELDQLRAFLAVADGMHMGRAAKRLHLAQPTLSRQIAALERELGVRLFSRARRRLSLTSAGQVFLDEAREILRRVDNARRDAVRAARGEIGTLRLGFVQSATYEVMPRLVRRFRTECPDVHLEISFMTTLQQLEALQSGALDAGLLRPQQPAGTPIDRLGLEVVVLERNSMVVALPAAHPLAARDEVALADLADQPFVLYTKEPGSTGYDLILDHCRRAGFTPDVVQHAKDAPTIVALVAAGLGVSLLIGPPPPIDPALVVYRPPRDALPTWDLGLAWAPENPSAALTRFLAIAQGDASMLGREAPAPGGRPRSVDAPAGNDLVRVDVTAEAVHRTRPRTG
ncbi:MAG TPA: LysR family transcriptional regulator [Actinopolymorphaceae bacterium]